MTPPNTPSVASQQARALLKTLQERFAVFRDGAPLAIGIDKQLLERLPEIERKTLRLALGIHTHSARYLKGMEKATHRLDLDGVAGEEISEAHRQHAAETLRERFKKDAERRKAANEAAARERQRTEKLSQLVQKFSKTK